MISVVLDTNVIISALVFGGNPRRVVQLAERRAYTMVSSDAIQNETERVLLEKFRWATAQVVRACAPIWDIAQIVVPQVAVTAAGDPDDNRILECALAGDAAVIVTGDQDLLRLNPYERIRIVSPAEFLRSEMWRRMTPARGRH